MTQRWEARAQGQSYSVAPATIDKIPASASHAGKVTFRSIISVSHNTQQQSMVSCLVNVNGTAHTEAHVIKVQWERFEGRNILLWVLWCHRLILSQTHQRMLQSVSEGVISAVKKKFSLLDHLHMRLKADIANLHVGQYIFFSKGLVAGRRQRNVTFSERLSGLLCEQKDGQTMPPLFQPLAWPNRP